MDNFINKLHIMFFIKASAISLACVIVYVLIANMVAYLLIRTKNDKRLFEVMIKSFAKLPLLLTTYGFIAGVAAYLWGSLVVGGLFGSDSTPAVAGQETKMNGSEVSLIMFTLLGFCVSVVVGWAIFFKAYKALNQNTKPEE